MLPLRRLRTPSSLKVLTRPDTPRWPASNKPSSKESRSWWRVVDFFMFSIGYIVITDFEWLDFVWFVLLCFFLLEQFLTCRDFSALLLCSWDYSCNWQNEGKMKNGNDSSSVIVIWFVEWMNEVLPSVVSPETTVEGSGDVSERCGRFLKSQIDIFDIDWWTRPREGRGQRKRLVWF